VSEQPEISLKDHFVAILAERDARHEAAIANVLATAAAAMAASDKAIDKAERANEKRMDATNEWRQTVSDIISGCVTRKELLAWMFGMVGFVATLVTLTALFFKK
jgi:hypothetical protein